MSENRVIAHDEDGVEAVVVIVDHRDRADTNSPGGVAAPTKPRYFLELRNLQYGEELTKSADGSLQSSTGKKFRYI